MNILAFDTSTKFLSVACLRDDEVLAAFHEDVGIRHSEILIPTIQDVLAGPGLDIGDVDLICVGLGPGSFTGLRIGVATVKGFAAVLGTKVVGVPTMDVMAERFSEREGHAAPFLDARKGKVYSRVYEKTGGAWTGVTGHLLVTAEEMLDGLEQPVFFFGDAVGKYRDKLDAHTMASYDEDADWYPRAEDVGRLGLKKARVATDDPDALDPLYLHAKECNVTKR